MKKRMRILLTSALIVASFVLAGAPAAVYAQPANGSGNTTTPGNSGGNTGGGSGVNVFQSCGAGGASANAICGAGTDDPDAFQKLMSNVINAILIVLGMIAVIMIIIGGIRYTTSNGDAQQTKAAKDTILYAVVGLVVAILAYAIVGFVLAALSE